MPKKQKEDEEAEGAVAGAEDKKRRRPSHKIIEQRYRSNLNDRITSLCDVVPTLANSDQKAHKPTILKKTQEYITHIQGVNDRLLEENHKLRALIKTLGGTNLLEKLGIFQDGAAVTPKDSRKTEEPAAEEQPQRQRGLGDGMRILIIFFMAFCLFSNPVTIPTSAAVSGDGPHQRHLTSQAQELVLVFGLTISEITSFVASVLVQVIFICSCLFMVFVGDPVASMTEHQIKVVTERKAQAEAELQKGHLEEASRLLNQVISLLGRPHRLAWTELLFSLIWQISRQVSHLCLLGGWVDRVLATRSPHSVNSFSVAAVAHHQFHKIQLARGSPDQLLLNSLVSITSLNLAEAVGMDSFFMARMHAAVALQLRLTLPKSLYMISWHYISQASKHLARVDGDKVHHSSLTLDWLSDTGSSLAWLSHPEGPAFFRHLDFEAQRPLLAHIHQTDDPFAKIGAIFADHLLKKAFVRLIQRVRGSLTLAEFRAIDKIAHSAGDRYTRWWALVGCTLSCWSMGQIEEGQRSLTTARDLYSRDLEPSVTASQVLMTHACDAFLNLLLGSLSEAAEKADLASAMIRQELEVAPPAVLVSRNEEACDLALLGQFVVCELLINTRLLLSLKTSQIRAPGTIEGPCLLSQDLRSFRSLSGVQRKPGWQIMVRSCLYIYKAASHSQSRGVPLRTEFLFVRGLQAARKVGDRHAEGLAHLYRACFGAVDVKEKKRLLLLSRQSFSDAGSGGFMRIAEEQLKLLSSS